MKHVPTDLLTLVFGFSVFRRHFLSPAYRSLCRRRGSHHERRRRRRRRKDTDSHLGVEGNVEVVVFPAIEQVDIT